MDQALKEIKEKLITYKEISKKERETDSRRESKELRAKIDEISVEIDELFDSYIDTIIPEEINVKIEVNKVVSVDTWPVIEAFRDSIYAMNPDELDTLNLRDKLMDCMLVDIDPEDLLRLSDFKISIND